MLQLAPGSVVLNQSSSHPMAGTVVSNDGKTLLVRWCDGCVFHEAPEDVTLTGASKWQDA